HQHHSRYTLNPRPVHATHVHYPTISESAPSPAFNAAHTLMTSSPDAHPLQSPPDSPSPEASLVLPKARGAQRKSPLSSLASLPYRSPNASLSTLFASTLSLPSSSKTSGTATPTASVIPGSVFSPNVTTLSGSSSPAPQGQSDETGLILRAFAPHVSILASPDTEELVRHKGIEGGLLGLLRPFGERIPGKVTIRDSNGASRSWDDFGIRFTGVKDGLEDPKSDARGSAEERSGRPNGTPDVLPEYRPDRLRTGGDVPQIEELVDRHLSFTEYQPDSPPVDYLNHKDEPSCQDLASSPFYTLYMRRLLSGLPMTPYETFSHPVASVIAISSRSPDPIEELRTLYASSNDGENRVPQWVDNAFLRYYVLVHDEDYDDITKSTALYEQMKRHFGLHCHLLRLRSTQCLASDDDCFKLPTCEWMSAAEELAEIERRGQ
ncbi:hypothetical protein LTR28_007751, partial [Elasticomyces elasticus]